MSKSASTLFDKVWDSHVVRKIEDGPDVFFIDRHFIHEVTSPVAFLGLEQRGIGVISPERTFATADHNTPTIDQHLPVKDALSANQLHALERNSAKYGISHWGLGNPKNGIVHVVGPENGITLPGMTIVCGDSHTSTHGAFGAIAFGIGTSEVEMVLSSQCIMQPKPKKMRINVNGKLNKAVLPKDVVLYIIAKLTAAGATGYFVEYAGDVFRNMSMEGRMTVCNMSIEMGARGGLIAPDEKTFSYVKGKLFAPAHEQWDNKLEEWKQLYSDTDAKFDKEIHILAADIEPMITYGTNPGMGVSVNGNIPALEQVEEKEKNSFRKSLDYMGLQPGSKMKGRKVDYVFIGSCTNSRIEDLRMVASFVRGKRKADDVEVWVVPGSKQVEKQAIEEGIDKVFEAAGFQLRQPGCSACLGMNEDKIPAGKYCISTSNRNFEGRQGPNARTFLASPLTAALAAITGRVGDVREFIEGKLEHGAVLEH